MLFFLPKQPHRRYGELPNQSINETASFVSMDDEFVPSSEADFISDDFDDSPVTPGWTKPLTQHKRALFRQLAKLEKESFALTVSILRNMPLSGVLTF